MKPTIAITLLIFFLAPAAVFGQAPQVYDYYEGIERARVKREKELIESNERKQYERLNKFARSLLRKQSEIYNESGGLFGGERIWTAGVYKVSGKLAIVEKGTVTIITRDGPVREKVTNFSEEVLAYRHTSTRLWQLIRRATESLTQMKTTVSPSSNSFFSVWVCDRILAASLDVQSPRRERKLRQVGQD